MSGGDGEKGIKSRGFNETAFIFSEFTDASDPKLSPSSRHKQSSGNGNNGGEEYPGSGDMLRLAAAGQQQQQANQQSYANPVTNTTNREWYLSQAKKLNIITTPLE